MLVPSTDQRGCVSFAEFCVRRRGFGGAEAQVDQPQIVAAAVGVEVGFALHVDQVAAAGRDLRIADARHRIEVGGREHARRVRRAGDVNRQCTGKRRRDAQP